MDNLLSSLKPFSKINHKVTSLEQRKALQTIFAGIDEGVWLVGGTALSGYYAMHRLSFDLDLFVKTVQHHQTVIVAIKTLSRSGWQLGNTIHTPHYFHTEVSAPKSSFTVDVVLDPALFNIGSANQTKEGVWVASVDTLLSMKCACLVSRCSEKDLYDLWWLQGKKKIPIEEIIARGACVDSGLTCEALLISLGGVVLRREACGFVLPGSKQTPEHVYKIISGLREELLLDCRRLYKTLLPSDRAKALKSSVRDMKR